VTCAVPCRYWSTQWCQAATATRFRDYFAQEEKRTDALDLPFRDLLRQYVRLHCTPETMLPIGGRYEMFPFVYFSSYDLHGMRRRAFTEGTVLMSTEMNILNMLLARD
jgi:hypothetical protein